MKEVKFAAEKREATDAFFDEDSHEYSPLQSFSERSKMSPRADNECLAADAKPVVDFLKQALLFFPGTFILFYMSLATAGVLTDLWKTSDRQFVFEIQLIFVYLLGLLSIFSTWFGFGDLKNKKHFVIPASIILSGAIGGIFVSLTENIFWLSQKIIVDFGYAVYLFPIALIIPILAKGWVDGKRATPESKT